MALLSEILARGIVGELPNCHRCGITQEQQKERDGPRSFLVSVKGQLVCGRCAVEMLQPVVCKSCNYSNQEMSKFCAECGEKLG